eukprot:gb/GECG01003956.1/.p1 GENE.gb/GECG01003956.1/~~gb/GECG01003956.1/.p1  ORF type:complete len:357 (+),score=45.93 gb/GECG01003956.1/:1-1071(+)
MGGRRSSRKKAKRKSSEEEQEEEPAEGVLSEEDEGKLFHACEVGDTGFVQQLINKLPLGKKLAVNNIRNDEGYTPLHIAAYSGDLEITRLLIRRGISNANDCKNDRSVTPLHYAAFKGDSAILRLLLEEGNGTPLQFDSKGYSPIHSAIAGNCPDTAVLLIKEADVDPNLNCMSAEGETPLHLACRLGFYDAAEKLQDAGADVRATDNKSRCVLHYMLLKADTEAVKSVIERLKLDPSEPLYNGYTPLQLCATELKLSMMKLLIEYFNQDPLEEDSDGDNALHLVCDEGGLSEVKYLVQKQGMDPTRQTKVRVYRESECLPLVSCYLSRVTAWVYAVGHRCGGRTCCSCPVSTFQF